MKKLALVLSVFILTLLSGYAQSGYSAHTGDGELDSSLKDINLNAHTDLSLFKKNLSIDFGIEDGKLDHLMVEFNLQPADLYMVLQIGKILNRSYEDIGAYYKNNRGRGWGVIAKDLGIKPGSKEFHMLKDSVKGKDKKMKSGQGGKGAKGKGKGKGKPKNK